MPRTPGFGRQSGGDSREQFERRTHKRLIDIISPTQKTVESLMSLELPAGVEIEIKLRDSPGAAPRYI